MATKNRIVVVTPTGPEMIRAYHRNITANTRRNKRTAIDMPPILTRAKLIVRQSREIVLQEKER